LLQALGDRLPFPDATFGGAFSNSVLEHIPDLDPVLVEVNRVLKPGAPFIITTPSQYFTEFLRGGVWFDRLHLRGLGDRYRRFFNRVSRHAHTDSPETWANRLAQAGFVIDRWQYYFSREALQALEAGHVQGLPSAILHALTGHWIVAPWKSSLGPTERWVRPFYEEQSDPERGAYLLFVVRKEVRGTVRPHLPPPAALQIHSNLAAGQPERPA
jgi:SAM-dependent methyltransferase